MPELLDADCVLLRSLGTWLKAKKNWDFFSPLDKITCFAPDWKYLGDMYLFPAFAAHLLERMFLWTVHREESFNSVCSQCDTRGGVAFLSSTALLGQGPREIWADCRVNAGCSCLNVVVP